MAKGGKTISGLFIPVGLDTSKMEDSIIKVKKSLEGLAYDVINTLDKNLDITKTVKNITTLYRSIGDVKNAAQALSSIKSGDFLKGLDKSQERLSELAKEFGISEQAQKKFLEQAYKTQAISQETSAIQALARSLGMANDEFLEFSKTNLGLSFSKEAMGKLFPDNAAEQIKQFTKEYKELVAISGSNVTLKQFVDTKRIQEAVNATKTLNNSQHITKKQYEDIARATQTTTEQVKEYIRQTERASKANRNLFVSAFTPSNITAGLQSAASAFGVVGGAYGIAELTKSAYQASMKMENLNLAFKSIYGSADIARDKLDFVKQVSDELGISFLVSAEGAKKMFAASKGTVLENDVEKIFKAFSSMGAALKLTGAEMDSVFLAISQSISKGRLTAEEVRLQLAERMPGAVNLLAKSIGVTTAELDDMFQRGQVGLKELIKFAEEVQRTYGEGAKQASIGLQAELNRVGNAWFNLKKEFVNTEGTAGTLRGVTDALNGIASMAPAITQLTSVLLGIAKAIIPLVILSKTLSFAKPVTELAILVTMFVKTEGALKALSYSVNYFLGVGSKFVALLGGWQTLLAGGIMYGVYKLAASETEAEKTLSKYNKTLDDYIQTSRDRIYVDNQVAENIIKTKDEVEKRLKTDVQTLLDPAVIWGGTKLTTSGFQQSLYNLIPTFTFGNKFQEMRQELSFIGSMGNDLAKEFMQGFENGMSEEELTKIFDRMKTEFDLSMRVLGNIEGIDEEVLEKIKKQLGQFLAPFDELRQKSKEVAKELENIGANIDFGDAFIRLKNLGKILGDTEIGKQQKIEQETTAILENVIALEKQRSELQKVLETDKEADNAKKQAIQVNEQYQNVLAAIPSYLMKNNISIRDFTDRLIEMASTTQDATGNMQNSFINLAETIKTSLQASVLQNFEASIAELQSKAELTSIINTFKKSNADYKGSTVEFLVKQTGEKPQVILDAIKQIKSGSVDVVNLNNGLGLTADYINDIETAYKKLSNSNVGGASKGISKTNNVLEKLKENLAKVNAELKGDKAESESIKYAKEIESYKKALSMGKMSAQARQEAEALIAQYEQATQALVAKHEELKRVQGNEEMNEAIRRSNQELLDLTGQGRQARIQVIKDSYDTELALWEEFKIKYNLSQEEFNEKVLILQQIRDAKLLQESTSVIDQLKLNVQEWYGEYENIAPKIADMTTDALQTMTNAVGEFVTSGVRDIKSLGQAFEDMANTVWQTATRIFANQMVSSLFQMMFSGLMPAQSSPITLGSGYFGGSMPLSFSTFSAKGNVFSNSPNLHKYSNSVIDKPTFFNYGNHVKAFAKGAGLMGEAGAEAVMPLIRTSSGHLGVRSVGSEKPTTIVSVNVINNSDAQVSTKQSQDNQGNLNLELMIEKQVGQAMSRPGSAPFKVLNNNYNARMALANR